SRNKDRVIIGWPKLPSSDKMLPILKDSLTPMNKPVAARTARSVCPHDCPSACALDIEVIDERTIGRVRGAKDDPYTAGVICEKVARYAERVHHPDRLLHPMRRTGPKGSKQFERISWDEALDEIGRKFLEIEAEHGAEAI